LFADQEALTPTSVRLSPRTQHGGIAGSLSCKGNIYVGRSTALPNCNIRQSCLGYDLSADGKLAIGDRTMRPCAFASIANTSGRLAGHLVVQWPSTQPDLKFKWPLSTTLRSLPLMMDRTSNSAFVTALVFKRGERFLRSLIWGLVTWV